MKGWRKKREGMEEGRYGDGEKEREGTRGREEGKKKQKKGKEKINIWKII